MGHAGCQLSDGGQSSRSAQLVLYLGQPRNIIPGDHADGLAIRFLNRKNRNQEPLPAFGLHFNYRRRAMIVGQVIIGCAFAEHARESLADRAAHQVDRIDFHHFGMGRNREKTNYSPSRSTRTQRSPL